MGFLLGDCQDVAIKMQRCFEWLLIFYYVVAWEFWVVAKNASCKGVSVRLLRCSEWLSAFCYSMRLLKSSGWLLSHFIILESASCTE